MKLSIALVLAGLFTVSMAHARKPSKPVTCLTWNVVNLKLDGDHVAAPVAICTDNEKPVILRTYVVVEILDEGGVKMPAVIGWK